MLKQCPSYYSNRSKPCQNPENVDAANESFRELAAAYEILSNPQSRESYDNERFGKKTDERREHGDGGQGKKPRRRWWTPKPVYDSYGHGEPNLNEAFMYRGWARTSPQ